MHSDTTLWKAVQQRDASQDGRFYYGVLTTGVFCKPSCPSRQPLRKNVKFYTDAQAALADGLRPCKRCQPMMENSIDQVEAERFQEVCRHIEAHRDETLPLAQLSHIAGLSPTHFQRRFKAVIGVSPKQYQEACRLGKLKQGLRQGQNITEAVYDAGFGSGSRVYEKLDTRLGMTPKQYRSGGKGLSISYASAPMSLGTLMMGATDRGLCFLQFGKPPQELLEILKGEYPQAQLSPMGEESKEQFDRWMAALEAYLQQGQTPLDLPLDIQGTAFQLKVWQYLQKIPSGQVQSYMEVAKGIGRPKAVRAVASACAANNLAIVVPCHRVIRGDGGLGGYRWGLETKRALIDQERRVAHAQPD